MSTSAAHQPIPKPDRIDPITTSVIQGALENIAVEMGYKLMRMSYSSIIRESEDFGAALVDAEGRGLAESAQSTPLQSGPIPGYVQGVQRILAERGDAFRPGDVVMHNDAYSGASHGPDVAFIVPVFVQGKLIAFAATTDLLWALVTLVGIGACQMAFMANNNTILQMTVPNELRGRVMSLYMLVQGITPAGALFAGAMTAAFGAPTTVMVMGVLCSVLGLLAGWRTPLLRQWTEHQAVAAH